MAVFCPLVQIRKGYSAELDRLIDKYLSRDALAASGIFSPGLIRLVRWIHAMQPFETRLRRTIDILLVFVLTVQILDSLYVRNFEASLTARASLPSPRVRAEAVAVQQ